MIYLATQCFPPDVGGIQSYMFNVADELRRQGEDVQVFADASHGHGDFDAGQRFAVRRFGGIKPLRRRYKAWALGRALEKRPGVVICDTWKSLELLGRTHPQTRVLCLAHGMEFPAAAKPGKVRRVRQALAKADRILANSRFTAERLRSYLPADKTVDVFLPGIATPVLPSAADRADVDALIAARGPVLLTVGRLEPRKGQDKAIAALPQLLPAFPRLLYVVVGDGPDLPRLQQLVASLGLQAHVHFAGRAVDAAKSAWFERTDLFVMASRAEGDSVEGFGLVYLEAGWFGVPSIAGTTGGAGDAVVDGETGLLCDGDDVAQVAQAIRRLLSDEPLRRSMGAAAQARVRSRFMWPAVIGALRDFFESPAGR